MLKESSLWHITEYVQDTVSYVFGLKCNNNNNTWYHVKRNRDAAQELVLVPLLLPAIKTFDAKACTEMYWSLDLDETSFMIHLLLNNSHSVTDVLHKTKLGVSGTLPDTIDFCFLPSLYDQVGVRDVSGRMERE